MQKKTMGYIALLAVAVVIAVGLFLALRGGGKETSSDSTTGTYRVALLINGPIDLGGWNSVGKAGVQLIENELGVQIAYSENVAEADYESTFRQYAKDGYDFVVGHGDEFVPAANVVAKEFPDTNFAVIGNYGNNNTNLGILAFRAGEMGYLLGTVAAVKSETNKIAYIGGQDLPVMQELATLYERGAKAYNPEIEVSVQWVGDWNNPDQAREIAQGLIGKGFDVLAVNAGGGDWAVFQAAEEAGIYVVASGTDQHESAPAAILTSAVLNVPHLLLEGVTLAQANRWEGGRYTFGIQEATQNLAPFYGLLTPEQEAIITTVKDGILSGVINTAP